MMDDIFGGVDANADFVNASVECATGNASECLNIPNSSEHSLKDNSNSVLNNKFQEISIDNSNTSEQSITLGGKPSNIQVKIKEHEKKNDDYIVYIIDVHTTDNFLKSKSNGLPNWVIARRFSDFDLLKSTLESLFPACLLPPLPDKIDSLLPWKYANQSRDPDFIENRRQRLESFLQRLLSHPQLGREELLLKFLLSGDEWKQDATVQSLGGKVVSFVASRSAGMRIRESSPVVEKLKEKAECIQSSIHQVFVSRQRANSHFVSMHKFHKGYGELFADWCGQDQKIADGLQTLGHLMDSYSVLCESLEEEEAEIVQQLQDQLCYAVSLMELCRRYESITLEMEKEADKLESKKKDLQLLQEGKFSLSLKSLKNKIKGPATESEREKEIENLKQNIDSSETRLHYLQEQVKKFACSVNTELNNFEREKQGDIQQTLIAYCNIQMQRSKRALRIWTQCQQTVNQFS